MDKDDLWIVEHFSELVTKYAGKYVAVVNEQLVAVGDSRRDVETKARTVEPDKIPSVLRVPREEDMVCLLSSLPIRGIKDT
jgi:GH35 family endo-1,4-beta-xylanase